MWRLELYRSGLNFSVFLLHKIMSSLKRIEGVKSSNMRFATERLSVATVSKPNSLLTPSILLREGVSILASEKPKNSNRIGRDWI